MLEDIQEEEEEEDESVVSVNPGYFQDCKTGACHLPSNTVHEQSHTCLRGHGRLGTQSSFGCLAWAVGERGADDAASCTSSMRPTRGLDDDGMTIATATTRDRMFFDCTGAAAERIWLSSSSD